MAIVTGEGLLILNIDDKETFNIYHSPSAERPRSCALQLKTQPSCQKCDMISVPQIGFYF